MPYRLILLSSFFISAFAFSQSKTFEYTGKMQSYTVPNGTTSISIDMYGASGGWNDYSGVKYDKYVPGNGGRVQAQLSVYPGQVLYIYVGGKGEDASSGKGGKGGFNGGGDGNTSTTYSGGGGGGATDIRLGGNELNHRVMVAGGGGGAAYNYPDGGDNGGHGGDLIGADGQSQFLVADESRGRGGSQKEGGLGGQWPSYDRAENGSLGKGGNGPAGTSGTGGGGGYYGGGGGCWSGGGGGSSFTNRECRNVIHTQGANEGDGKIIIQVNCIQPTVSISGPTNLCLGQSIRFNAQSNTGGYLSWDKGVINNQTFIPPAGKTIYTVTSSNSKECSYSVELNVGSGSLKATTTNGIICEGETTTLIGYGAENYIWSNGVQNNVPFAPTVGVHNYSVRSATGVIDGCGGEASVFVVVNKVVVEAKVQEATYNKAANIDLTSSGGTFPYSYYWKKDGYDFSKTEDLYNLSNGKYTVLIVDAIGCSTEKEFTVSSSSNTFTSNQLSAQVSTDKRFLALQYSGYFDYQILNDRQETMITGAVNNSGQVDISKFPPGYYSVCSLFDNKNNCVNFSTY